MALGKEGVIQKVKDSVELKRQVVRDHKLEDRDDRIQNKIEDRGFRVGRDGSSYV